MSWSIFMTCSEIYLVVKQNKGEILINVHDYKLKNKYNDYKFVSSKF